jgi:hypothetical protein
MWLIGPVYVSSRSIAQAWASPMAKDRPRTARLVFANLRLVARFLPGVIVKQAMGIFSPPDRELLRRADFQRRFIAMFREAHRMGGELAIPPRHDHRPGRFD